MAKHTCLILALICLMATSATAQVPDEFTNLKLIPKDTGKRELMGVMRQFAGALGVRCNHCHVGPDNLEGMDFATDELETKRVAREMMKMTDQINGTLLPAAGRKSPLTVRCVTCHRGVTRPEQLGELLMTTLESGGVDAAIAEYGELREDHYGSGAYDFGSSTLASLAESVAGKKGDMPGAIKLVELNIKHYPDTAYNYIMLGQLQMQSGDKTAALAALERAVALEPNNEYAKRMLGRVKTAE